MNEKLIKGVLYDDIDKKSFKLKMIENIPSIKSVREDEIYSLLGEENDGVNKDSETIFDELKTSLTIKEIIRYDSETETNLNLIIPKECLSTELEEVLRMVDIGKNLHNNYLSYVCQHDTTFSDCEDDDEYNPKPLIFSYENVRSDQMKVVMNNDVIAHKSYENNWLNITSIYGDSYSFYDVDDYIIDHKSNLLTFTVDIYDDDLFKLLCDHDTYTTV